MKSFNKKINKTGAITLPSALRRDFGLTGGEKFKIEVCAEDGTILLQRTNGQCLFCDSDKQLIVHRGRFVCANCVEQMDVDVSERKFANAFVGQEASS
ncbi:AbrB/MazE/SpoVT family DNA-binding domain-containing protein [Paenibacillus sp. DYY-L-2]|uniref:AbrB/MazE/SpoVT family DNA-binding domain-containing protein n=1 Tax=Paenibacillus sp. DYY-L-2 TaxID=3447013 RepID=UPI003F506F88